MTPAFRYTLLWLAGSVLAMFAAMAMLSGGYFNGEFLPSNPDAFTANVPPQFKLRWQVLTPDGQIYARLYEIERTP